MTLAGRPGGDLRSGAAGHQIVYFETNDAGAVFRFTDTYAKMFGGQMWLAMDPPTADQSPQDGEVLVSFEAASFLLLVAAVGAVVLARRRRGLEEPGATPEGAPRGAHS